jgi:hypothetical protein
VTVIGEALIDLVPGPDGRTFVAAPGGSPYNVAIGLARLGVATRLMARLADNAFGRILRERAVAEGVGLAYAPLASEPTTLAVVSLDAGAGELRLLQRGHSRLAVDCGGGRPGAGGLGHPALRIDRVLDGTGGPAHPWPGRPDAGPGRCPGEL